MSIRGADRTGTTEFNDSATAGHSPKKIFLTAMSRGKIVRELFIRRRD
jgi:hypothetical protein